MFTVQEWRNKGKGRAGKCAEGFQYTGQQPYSVAD